ncbi:MAG: lipoate--protein ligase family protein [Chloroflexi bacterium]|nr:lipoate--protein ligase family protein [Chloroflexota bacterium]
MPRGDQWRLLDSGVASGPYNMAVDEAVMETHRRGLVSPTLRFYGWSPPCLSVGYFQSVTRDILLHRCQEAGVTLVRRPTGGRAVLHWGELTYSLVVAEDDPRLAGGVLAAYRRVSSAIAQGLSTLGVTPQLREPWHHRGPPARNGACFHSTSVYELTVAGRKLVGSAQLRRDGVLLQHGSLLWKDEGQEILSLLRFTSEEERHAAASHFQEQVVSLRQLLGEGVDWESIVRSLRQGFQEVLGISLGEGQLIPEEEALAKDLVDGKYGTPEWNLRK